MRTNVDAVIADLEITISGADQSVASMGTPNEPGQRVTVVTVAGQFDPIIGFSCKNGAELGSEEQEWPDAADVGPSPRNKGVEFTKVGNHVSN